MAELYPSETELAALSGTTDSEQEVLFILTGESPYYISFYKMLHRLLNVARRAGDLRVYKDGNLTFGVRAGKFMDGSVPREYAGSEENALTNNTTNHIYLQADGTLRIEPAHSGADDFPDPDVTAHIPLATLVTAAGAYGHDDITDCRGWTILQVPAAQQTVTCSVPLRLFRKTNADYYSNLPSSGVDPDFGIVGGTHGTASPKLQSDSANNGSITAKARTEVVLPAEYIPGAAVTLRARARVDALPAGDATLDAEVFKCDREGGVDGQDLCTTAAQDIKSTSWADEEFSITATDLLPGDKLDIELTASVDDTGGGGAHRAEIGAVEVILSARK